MANNTDTLVVVPLENKVLLPSVVLKLSLKGKDALTLTRKHLKANEQRKPTYIACIPYKEKVTPNGKDGGERLIRPEDKEKLYEYGCTARIIRVQRSGLGVVTVFVEGVSRFKVSRYITDGDNPLLVKAEYFPEQPDEQNTDEFITFKALVREFLTKMKDLHMPDTLIQQLTKLIDSVSPPVLSDLLVSVIETSFEERLDMLSTTSLKDRVRKASEWMTRQLHVRLKNRIIYIF
jgi:ATP-dependent Lon protease